MSWMQRLYETYEACSGNPLVPDAGELFPLAHTHQQAQVEIVLNGVGEFLRARVLTDKSERTTLIPCTEASVGRSGRKPVNHPLCDKLQYVAADFVSFGGEATSGFKPGEAHAEYLDQLTRWAESEHGEAMLDAILAYVRRGHVVGDLVRCAVLPTTPSGALSEQWDGDADKRPEIFGALAPGQVPGDAFVRFRVEVPGRPESGTWESHALVRAWQSYQASGREDCGFCFVTGREVPLADQHPAKLRNAADKAKLISSNDGSGFTYRGRFIRAEEVAGVSFEVTEKAHSALRWLIGRQRTSTNGGQVYVAWTPRGVPVPDLMDSTAALLGLEQTIGETENVGDVGQAFAGRLSRAMNGYRASLNGADRVVVMGVDAATPGRMSITYYRDLPSADLLERVERWHARLAWPQNFGAEHRFVGAPSPRDIADVAFWRRLKDNEDLRRSTIARILPCIVDGSPIPRDLVESAVRHSFNRSGLECWEWEKSLGIACALFRGAQTTEEYGMSLDESRSSRDYLYGRLLAIADHVESRALFVAKETRDTTAARLMQRFADRPYATWPTIEHALAPYKARLRGSGRSGFVAEMERLVDDIMSSFPHEAFVSNARLSGEALLGYHCQRRQLWTKEHEHTTDSETKISEEGIAK